MAPKRQTKRWSQRLRVNVWEIGHDHQIVGYTENVSGGGVFLAVPQPLIPGSRVRMEIVADEETYMCDGVVVHIRRVPRELQKVKHAGMGISLVPFETFLRHVKSSGMTQTASGIWHIPEGLASSGPAAVSEASARGAPAGSSAARAAPPSRPAPARPRPAPVPPPTRAHQPPTASRPAAVPSEPAPSSSRSPRERRPASAASDGRSRAEERKQGSGGELVYPVRFDDRESFVHCVDHDVKMGIFLVPTQVPASDHSRVTLEFYVPGKERPLRFAAEVVRGRQPGEWGGGAATGMLVRFLEPAAVIRSLQLVAGNLRG